MEIIFADAVDHKFFVDAKLADGSWVELEGGNYRENTENIGVLNERGTIEVGKRADFTVLDNEFNVLYTVVGGNVVYKA
jgi:N-acyl-D-aspartate/D-glutamate deacylase